LRQQQRQQQQQQQQQQQKSRAEGKHSQDMVLRQAQVLARDFAILWSKNYSNAVGHETHLETRAASQNSGVTFLFVGSQMAE